MFCIRIRLTSIYCGSTVYHYVPSTTAKNCMRPYPSSTLQNKSRYDRSSHRCSRMSSHPEVMEDSTCSSLQKGEVAFNTF